MSSPTGMPTNGIGKPCNWLSRRSIAEVESEAAARAAAEKARIKADRKAEREAKAAARRAEAQRDQRIPYAGRDRHETQVQAYDWERAR